MNALKMMMGGGMNSPAELAELVRQFGRGRDKVLAHITPEEAVKLKEMGGAGTINPITGLPEFQDDALDQWFRNYYANDGVNEVNQAFDAGGDVNTEIAGGGGQDVLMNLPSYEPVRNLRVNENTNYLPPDALQELQTAEISAGMQPSGREVAPAGEEETFGAANIERQLRGIKETLDRNPLLTRVGTAGANLLAQGLLARRANRAAEQQARFLREQAVPFRQASEEAMGRARGGGLTPTEARALESAQARARQGLGAQNLGEGSAAAGILAGQETRARSVARQQSFDEAMRLARIADDYQRRALSEELARDQELARLFGEVVAAEIGAATRTGAPTNPNQQQQPVRR